MHWMAKIFGAFHNQVSIFVQQAWGFLCLLSYNRYYFQLPKLRADVREIFFCSPSRHIFGCWKCWSMAWNQVKLSRQLQHRLSFTHKINFLPRKH
jgi:hypothetical protein